MLFNSAEFIFGFLPAVLLGFYLITRRGRTDLAIYFLAAASVFFYGWWNFDLVWLLAGSVVANYLFGRWLARRRVRPLLAVGIVFNLGLLGWFKYAGFFASVANDVSGASFSLGPVILREFIPITSNRSC